MRRVWGFLAFVFFFVATISAYGDIVDTYGVGAKAIALGTAFTARADDFSAMYYNPAGIAQLERPQVSVGSSFVNPAVSMKLDYHNDHDSGHKTSVADSTQILIYPHGGVVYPFKLFGKKAAFGVATYVPYGFWLRWNSNPRDNSGAYNSYQSYYYRVVRASPTFAIQLTKKLFIGVGLAFGDSHSGVMRRIYMSPLTMATAGGFGSYTYHFGSLPFFQTPATSSLVPDTAAAYLMFSQDPNLQALAAANGIDLNQVLAGNPAAVQGFLNLVQGLASSNPEFAENFVKVKVSPLLARLKDGKMRTRATDDFNWSFNIGVIYRFSDKLQVGLTYRGLAQTRFFLKTKMYDGSGNEIDEASGHTWIDHPDQLEFGILYRPIPKLSIEADLKWVNWARIHHYRVHWNNRLLYDYFVNNGVPSNIAKALSPGDKKYYPRHWKNMIQPKIGVQYQLFNWLALRGGYFYDPCSVPHNTYDTTWPGASKHIFSLGTGLKLFHGKVIADLAYQYTMIEGHKIIDYGRSENLDETYGTEDEHPEAKAKGWGYVHNFALTLTYKF